MILDVPFYDVDPMNIVWHGNYIKYLEQARCDMFSKIGYTFRRILKCVNISRNLRTGNDLFTVFFFFFEVKCKRRSQIDER